MSNETQETRVVVYGLPRHLTGQREVADQISRAHRYYNHLIETERTRRERVMALYRAADPEGTAARVETAVAGLADALAAAKAAKAAEGTRRVPASEVARVCEARRSLRLARAQWQETRQQLKEPLGAQVGTITTETAAIRRALRAVCGVYWGSYLLIEAAAEVAARSLVPPHFRSWAHGAGRLGVQLQGGLEVAAVMAGTDTRLRIAPPMVEADRGVSRRHDPARGVGRSTVQFRIGSTADREPVWATWQIVLDRPLPADGRVKQATMVRRVEPGRFGADQYRDELHLTIEAQPAQDVHMASAESRREAVALDIGWRRLADGSLRIAAWHDNVGDAGIWVLVPADIEASLTHVASLQSLRDQRLDAVRADLVAWTREHPWPATWPEPLRRRLTTLARWRSPMRLALLWRHWTRARFEGDEEGYVRLAQWWAGTRQLHDHGDRHLAEWQGHERQTALRRRRERYREWAAWLTRRYRTIVIESFDLRTVSARPATEQEESVQATLARAQRVMVAIDQLRQAIRSAAKRRGVQVVTVPAAYSTQTCPYCQTIEAWDAAATVQHTCGHCAAVWDQDAAAAMTLLRRWRKQPSEVKIVVAARGAVGSTTYAARTGGRWSRRKAAKAGRSQEAAQVAVSAGVTSIAVATGTQPQRS